ncbi:hypothetical protein RJT34_13671 [Clitoria ternatea]|uniref:Uncharacterized protein n=1 Tax=Clitoria ternatea TaxID=43366 RepID=A0AAN9JNZ4_CLITE
MGDPNQYVSLCLLHLCYFLKKHWMHDSNLIRKRQHFVQRSKERERNALCIRFLSSYLSHHTLYSFYKIPNFYSQISSEP